MYGGYRPKIDGTWTVRDGHIVGTLRSDVPFGRFDVPIRVATDAGVREVWVGVVDGVGAFELPIAEARLTLDPDPRALARARSLRRVDAAP